MRHICSMQQTLYYISNVDGQIHNTNDVSCKITDKVVEVLAPAEPDSDEQEVIDTCDGYTTIGALLMAAHKETIVSNISDLIAGNVTIRDVPYTREYGAKELDPESVDLAAAEIVKELTQTL